MEIQKNIAKPFPDSDSQLILGIESSGQVCSAALSLGEEILGEYSLFELSVHDEMLAELINRLLTDCRIEIKKLDAVAVSAGPGSFTGLRIGSAIAKGICFDNKIKLVPVGSLYSIAFAFREFAVEYQINDLAVLTFSHGKLYFYQKFDLINALSSNIELLEFGEIFKKAPSVKLFLTTDRRICHGDSHFIYVQPSAKQVCSLGHKLLLDGKFVPAESFVPDYHFEFNPKSKKQ